MRILLINKFFWPKGGSERVFFDLMDGYEAAGHATAVFSMKSDRNRPSSYERFFVEEKSWDGTLAQRVRTGASVIYSREAYRNLRSLIRTARPDVAHLHNFHHQLTPSVVDALRVEGIPAVYTLHDYKPLCPNYLFFTEGAVCERCRGGRYWNAVAHRCVRDSRSASFVAAAEATWHAWRRTLRRGIRRYVSPSRFLRDKMTEFGTDAARVDVVRNGLDPDAFRPVDGLGDEFVYAGRLSREKGLRTLVTAVGRQPDLRLVICGTGPEEEALRRQSGEEAPGRVEFAGHLAREDLDRRVRNSRAVILPSEWYENAPISALESLAAGVPVIASGIGGLPEIVRDGETGLLFPPGDADALAARMLELAADRSRAEEFGRRGRRTIEEEFRLDRQVDEMLAILEEVASSGSR